MRQPVQAIQNDAGEWENSLSFDELARCQIQHRAPTARQLPIPIWGVNTTAQRRLLVRFMEFRAGLNKPQPGSERERLERAQQRLLARRPQLEATLYKLLAALRAGPPFRTTSKMGARGRFLARRKFVAEIYGIDSQLVLLNSPGAGAGIILRVIALAYGCGFGSVAVASEVGSRPPAVRMLLHRLHRTWERMGQEAQPVTTEPAEAKCSGVSGQ